MILPSALNESAGVIKQVWKEYMLVSFYIANLTHKIEKKETIHKNEIGRTS